MTIIIEAALYTVIILIVSVFWTLGIDDMKDNHSDYHGEDFLDEQKKL